MPECISAFLLSILPLTPALWLIYFLYSSCHQGAATMAGSPLGLLTAGGAGVHSGVFFFVFVSCPFEGLKIVFSRRPTPEAANEHISSSPLAVGPWEIFQSVAVRPPRRRGGMEGRGRAGRRRQGGGGVGGVGGEESSADPLATRRSWLGLPQRCPRRRVGATAAVSSPTVLGRRKLQKEMMSINK